MLCIIGKTASGKDTIVNKLIYEHGFKKIVTYTTRDMRTGEKDGVTYHYISEEDFRQKIEKGFFAEWKSYDTEFGIWYYGSALEDLEKAEDNSVIILTPEGLRDVVGVLGREKITSIYIYANNSTIKKRLTKRGDDPKEAERRFEKDTIDFKGVENEVDRIVYNNDGYDIDDVVKKILEIAR